MGIREDIAFFRTINDPPGLKGLMAESMGLPKATGFLVAASWTLLRVFSVTMLNVSVGKSSVVWKIKLSQSTQLFSKVTSLVKVVCDALLFLTCDSSA